LYTTITPSATNVAAGTSVTFTVTQGNQGPNAAASVVNRVALPIGLPITGAWTLKIGGNAPTSTTGTVATYGSGSAAITYDSSTGIVTFASLATQAVAATPASYTLTFNAPASGVLVASSTVASTTPDVMLSNNVASTQITIDPAATDVATALTGPDAATPGQRVTFAVATTNNGPAAAANVVQTVVIPAGLPIVGTTAVTIGGNAPTSTASTVATYANGATYNSATGVVTFATIASQTAGNTASTIIAYAVPANGDASLVSTARVTSTSTDRVPANNAASVVTTIQTSADVQVALSGPGTAVAGALVSYGVTTTNNGPSVAAAVATTVQLPAGLSNVTVIGFDGTVLASAYNSSTGLVTFPAVSSQAAGAASTGSLSFAAPDDVNILTPTAMATVSGTTDPTLSNNSATVATTLTAPTGTADDLAVTLGRSSATAAAGSAISFSFAVTNNGSTPATGVVATVQLPAGLPTAGAAAVTVAGQAPSSASGTVAVYNFPGVSLTYDSSTGLLVSTGTSLNAGATVGASIGIPQAPGTGPVVATATVRGDQPDADLTNNLATQRIAITAVADVATAISGPDVAPNGGPVAYTVVTSNAGLSPIGGVGQTVTLPAGITGYSLNGTAVVLGSTPTAGTTTITLPTPATLAAGAAGAVANTISFVAPPGTTFSMGANVTGTGDTNPANNSATQTTTRFNAPPVATNVTNTLQTPEGSTATVAMLISPLAATSAASTIKQYNLSTVVPTAQGVLYYDNNGTLTAITTSNYASVNLTATQATTLRFLPAAGYVGNATFTYTATDNNNLLSNVATYLIPVGLDNSSVYTNSTQVKGGSNKYVNNDVLAYVIDSNTAQYNSSGQLYNTTTGVLQGGAANGLTSAGLASGSNALPAGVSLNPTTGQLYVSDAAQLVNNQNAQTYTVRVTTTDLNGGTNTQNVTFTIGAYPLPVTLVAFTTQAVQNRDALLNWSTASEVNNDHFEIERSFDGRTFAQIGQVAGHGTTTAASAYALTDAGVATKATGPVYYRLRQVDLDGTATYSPVRTVSFTKAAVVALSLYPNPVADLTTLDLRALDATTLVQAQLLDAAGRAVRSWALAGGQLQSLDLSDLASGSYLLVVTGQQPDTSPLRQVLRVTKK
ncbi:MAG: T9SS type A sorting domain-containing protein, partial [Hymenobacter sp.]